MTVKEVKLKELPEVDDDFAIDAGFDDLERAAGRHPRAAARGRRGSGSRRSSARRRWTRPSPAHASRSRPSWSRRARAEMWERMLHSLSHRGISREAYLRIAGRQEAEILAEMAPEAELALRREAVITAVVAAERIEPTEEELLAGARAARRARGARAGGAVRRAARGGAPGGAARGTRGAPGDRPDRRARRSRSARAGPGAGAAVDARQGREAAGGAAGEPAEAHLRGCGPPAIADRPASLSRGIRPAKRNKGEDYEPERGL